MKTYKGFNRNMTCRNFQYKEGETYETKKAICCETGFHGCEYPLDCFRYYYPAESVFHEVEQFGKIDKNCGDSKISSTKIKIGPRLSITGLAEAAIDFIMSRIKSRRKDVTKSDEDCSVASSTGDFSATSSTGDCAVASSTGSYSVASSTGSYSVASSTSDYSVASSTGSYSVASSIGYCAVASSTADYSVASSTGWYSATSSTGDCAVASSTADYSVASSTGHCSAASSTGSDSIASSTGSYSVASSTGHCSAASSGHETSIAVAWGYGGKAKGILGSYIVLADWRNKSGENRYCDASDWEFKGAKMIKIDGKRYKPDTWYAFNDGKIVEVGEDD